MKDRFTIGFVAGIVGGIIMAAIDLIFSTIGWVHYAYYDWAISLIMGSKSNTIYEAITGQITHILFSGMLGILFAYLLALVKSKNYILKGWVFGIFVWFAVHVIVNLYDFDPLRPIPLSQMVGDFITGSIFGIVLAEVINRLSLDEAK